MTLPLELADRLRAAGLDPEWVEWFVTAALDEDLAGGVDVTSESTVPAGQRTTGDVVARRDGVVAGLPVAEAVFAVTTGGEYERKTSSVDGDAVRAGDVLMSISGSTRALLVAERTALNVAGRLSGIATLTRAWVDAVAGTGAVIRDTRKTTPLLRPLEKYAVRCGGGQNHRMSLSDAALIKDNHVVAAGGVAAAYRAVADRFPDVPVEVEVDDVAGAVEAAEAGASLVLLDNFAVAEVTEAVRAVAEAAVRGRTRLEVSGGLTLDTVRPYAEAGVDYLAVGALTHSAPALDIAFDLGEVA
ncbi:MAG TPA: carboxylating nicotinate-nucleotide diphosphorylase [Jiangellaceae bacterium]